MNKLERETIKQDELRSLDDGTAGSLSFRHSFFYLGQAQRSLYGAPLREIVSNVSLFLDFTRQAYLSRFLSPWPLRSKVTWKLKTPLDTTCEKMLSVKMVVRPERVEVIGMHTVEFYSSDLLGRLFRNLIVDPDHFIVVNERPSR